MARQLVYRVYEVALDTGETCHIAVSNVREVSLREEISAGHLLMEIRRLVLETTDRNEARKLAVSEW